MLGEEPRTEEHRALTEPATDRLVRPDVRDEFGLETIDMNMGPQHPAMHGLLRLILTLDGETIMRCDPIMGYLHRCQEKIAENRMYPAVIPMTDRLDYFANMHNEHGYCLAVEDLLEAEIPPRAEAIRVLMCELMRLASHIPSIGFLMLELGAFTPILYAFRERERIQNIFEAVTGARMMFHYLRIGGVKDDLPAGWIDESIRVMRKIYKFCDQMEELLLGNEIFQQRTRGVGIIPAELAQFYGLSGANLRASGVDWDLRRDKDMPMAWKHADFKVITHTDGDSFARTWCRLQEIRESTKIITQLLDDLPSGPIMAKVPRIIKVPEGEAYVATENPLGEMGYYVVSKGDLGPFRVKIRTASFSNVSITPWLLKGVYVPDIIAILGSLYFILGDIDR
jgi:NADH-quinone oxidoreductase subunit D